MANMLRPNVIMEDTTHEIITVIKPTPESTVGGETLALFEERCSVIGLFNLIVSSVARINIFCAFEWL